MSNYGFNYIAGRWQASDKQFPSINPSEISDRIGDFSQAEPKHIDSAVEAAMASKRAWRETPLEARQTVLMRIGDELIGRAPELGELLSREEGKPRAEGVGEVHRAGQFFQYFAAEVLRQIGENADSVRPGIEIDVRREPVGVVAVISPWNFPVATASWKIAPALAYGNAVLWKPSEETPAVAWELARIIASQDIPEGLFSLLMGPGSVGAELVSHPGVDAITFTGSVEVGKTVAQAAASRLAKVQLEMGSKNALLVADDADLELAVRCAANGAFSGTGQKCTASSRLVVHRKVHDQFVDKLETAMGALKVGHALKQGTEIGPVVSERQLMSNLSYVELAAREGGTKVSGGDRVQRETEGYYMAPALFVDTHNHMQVNREEMFAPMACVIPVDNYEQGLHVVNDTRYGLTSGIITQSLARAAHFRRNAEAGCVMVNLPTAGTDYHVPFGGRKDSSYGPREQGQHAAEFYTQMKTSYISAGEPDLS